MAQWQQGDSKQFTSSDHFRLFYKEFKEVGVRELALLSGLKETFCWSGSSAMGLAEKQRAWRGRETVMRLRQQDWKEIGEALTTIDGGERRSLLDAHDMAAQQ